MTIATSTTISALTAGVAPSGTEVGPFDQGTATVKLTADQLLTRTAGVDLNIVASGGNITMTAPAGYMSVGVSGSIRFASEDGSVGISGQSGILLNGQGAIDLLNMPTTDPSSSSSTRIWTTQGLVVMAGFTGVPATVTFPLYGTPDATIKGLHSLTTASGGQVVMLGGDSSSGPGGGVTLAVGNPGTGSAGNMQLTAGYFLHMSATVIQVSAAAINQTATVRVSGNLSVDGAFIQSGNGVQLNSTNDVNVSAANGIRAVAAAKYILLSAATYILGSAQNISLVATQNMPLSAGGIITTQGFAAAPVTAVAGAATVNAQAGTVTSEALVGAVAYTLTLTNSTINANSVVMVTPTNSANLPVTINSITPGSGTCTIVVGMAALTGTVKIAFAVFN